MGSPLVGRSAKFRFLDLFGALGRQNGPLKPLRCRERPWPRARSPQALAAKVLAEVDTKDLQCEGAKTWASQHEGVP